MAGVAVVLALTCSASAVASVRGSRAAPVSKTVVVVTNTSDRVNGHVSSIAALNAHPGRDGISLREALKAADHTRGTATVYVMFSHALNGRTIAPRSVLPAISRNHVVLEGIAPSGARARVTIDGSHEPSLSNPALQWLLLVHASDVTIRWLHLTSQNLALRIRAGVPPSGVTQSCAGAATSRVAHVQILDDVFDGVAMDVGTAGCGSDSDITIARNTFLNQAVDAVSIDVLAPYSGMSLSGVVIEDNTIHGDNPIELGTGGNASRLMGTRIIGNTIIAAGRAKGIGIAFDSVGSNAITDGTVIAANTISGFDRAGAIGIAAQVTPAPGYSGPTPYGDVVSNTQIVNNVISQDSPSAAIGISGGGSSPPSGVSGVTIENDTLVNTATGGPGWLLMESPGSAGNYITGVVIRNSILWSPNGTPIPTGVVGPGNYAQPPNVVTNSLISGPSWAGSNGNINANPMFVNEAGGNYHLSAGSPAINAGTTIGALPFDLDGARRDAQPDIGAYEYGVAPRPLLTVTADPLGGNGTITSNPTAISCGTTCTAQLDAKTKITLTAKPDSRSRFLGWGGACSTRKTRCTTTLDHAKTLTARFGPRYPAQSAPHLPSRQHAYRRRTEQLTGTVPGFV